VLNDGIHLRRGKNTISLHGCGVEKPQLIQKKKKQMKCSQNNKCCRKYQNTRFAINNSLRKKRGVYQKM
jgi:hypothetical protein